LPRFYDEFRKYDQRDSLSALKDLKFYSLAQKLPRSSKGKIEPKQVRFLFRKFVGWNF